MAATSRGLGKPPAHGRTAAAEDRDVQRNGAEVSASKDPQAEDHQRQASDVRASAFQRPRASLAGGRPRKRGAADHDEDRSGRSKAWMLPAAASRSRGKTYARHSTATPGHAGRRIGVSDETGVDVLIEPKNSSRKPPRSAKRRSQTRTHAAALPAPAKNAAERRKSDSRDVRRSEIATPSATGRPAKGEPARQMRAAAPAPAASRGRGSSPKRSGSGRSTRNTAKAAPQNTSIQRELRPEERREERSDREKGGSAEGSGDRPPSAARAERDRERDQHVGRPRRRAEVCGMVGRGHREATR